MIFIEYFLRAVRHFSSDMIMVKIMECKISISPKIRWTFGTVVKRKFVVVVSFLLWSSCHFSQCMYMMYTWTQDTVLITEVLIIEFRIEHSITSSVLSYSTYIMYIVLVIKGWKWWFHLSWFLFLFNPRKFLAVSSPSFCLG